MPLYHSKNEQGQVVERVRAVAGSPEDERLADSKQWHHVAEPSSGDQGGEPPAKSASKDEWAAYAITRGVPSYEAHEMTKDQLMKASS